MTPDNIATWNLIVSSVRKHDNTGIQGSARKEAVLAVAKAIDPLLRSCDIRVNEEFVEGWIDGKCVIVVSRDKGIIVEVKPLPGDLRQAEAMLAIGLQAIQRYREIRDKG
jgi:hypothetical protein